ncbi:molybdopterin molybdotransferase MoeA [Haloglycomyces albus]|uniref:molybdopterin molybdotransferase MoeA n=1 Tax=Haloglycomyces albus TaxID=526067 RepID=UPI00046D30C5|nr:molybdopterin molybdotransferase MoeA [Haloglycomyces albus]
MNTATDWRKARDIAYRVGQGITLASHSVPLTDAIGHTLAEPVRAANPLPAFDTVAMDGYAIRGEGPWRLEDTDQLAGTVADPLSSGHARRIATGAQLPPGTDGIIRLEDSTESNGQVNGPHQPDWRHVGEEINLGDTLFSSGRTVTPALAGFAAAAGNDEVSVWSPPTTRLAVFGDELVSQGPARDGKIRDSLGPMLPAVLDSLGAAGSAAVHVADTPEDHLRALENPHSTITLTTGGTMHGPVDYLHPTLQRLNATYHVNTVAVRPGFPMLLAETDSGIVCGLPGNPQSALIAIVTLVAPLIDGMLRRDPPDLSTVTVADDIAGRGDCTRLALVDHDGRLVAHHGSAMLRGVAAARGFAVVPPHAGARAGQELSFLSLSGISY